MSVKTYDFIIGYENKVRELESAYLLKYELEKRGYSVFVFQELNPRYDDVMEVIYHAKVLIISSGYADKYLESFIRRFISFDKLINWQWEQMFYRSLEEDPDSEINVHGDICRQAVQLAWGDYNVKRVLEVAGLPESHVIKTGITSMDFVKPEFSGFYKTREEICREYGINPKYKIAILIGTFARAFASKEEIEQIKKNTGIDFTVISVENRKRFDIVMEWIGKALREDENLFFIYRPHPGDELERCPEDVQKLVRDMMAETGRLICNQDYTVRQWITAVDRCYMGYSTTMVDAYFAKVGCVLLSPAGIPVNDPGYLFEEASETTTYEEFKASLDDVASVQNPLLEERIKGYYGENNGLVYPKVADAFETVYKDDVYFIDTSVLRKKISETSIAELKSKSFGKRLKLKLWKYDWFYNLYWKIMGVPIKLSYFVRQQEYRARINQYVKRYIGTKEEIAEIDMRIRKCLEKG